MKVSVLLTTYNHERYIAEAIESVLMQETTFDFEIVVSEDCSTDRTREIVESYRERHSDRIRARYSPDNRGEETWVRSYRTCRGQYVALLDGDDYWTSPQKLQKEADFLDRHPECSMCAHAMIVTRQDSDEPPLEYTWPKEVSTIEDLILNNFVCTASAMLRKEAFDDHPPWVYEAPFTDYPLWMQVAQHGCIGYINEFLGVYRVHAEGAWSGKTASSQVEELIVFHNRIRQELGPGYDHVFERVLARLHGQLACERAGIPDDAIVLMASGGDPELLKALPGRRHFQHFPRQPDGAGIPLPRRGGELVELLEASRAEGAQFLLVPRPALAQLRGHTGLHRLLPRESRHGLRRELDRRYRQIWDSPDAALYRLVPVAEGSSDRHPRGRTRTSTPSWLLPTPIRRLREHLREIRRLSSETQQAAIESYAGLSRQIEQLDASVRDQAEALSRIEARLESLAQAAAHNRSTGADHPS